MLFRQDIPTAYNNGEKGFAVALPKEDVKLIKDIRDELGITMGDILEELWESYVDVEIKADKRDKLNVYAAQDTTKTTIFVCYQVHKDILKMQKRNELSSSHALCAILLWSSGWFDIFHRYSVSLNEKANNAYKRIGIRMGNR